MSGLLDHLKARITAQGPIDVGQYMEECLSNPDFGYYQHQQPFGASGDFITAPDISQMFGELLGLWAVHQWHAMGKPASFHLVELGPGRGTLMADALRAARGAPGFIQGLHLHLVETSQRLRDIQNQALTGYQPQWHDEIGSLPAGPLIVIANEFFDALPIQQFEYTSDGWLQRRIGVAGDRLVFSNWPPAFSVARETAALAPQPGDIFEVAQLSQIIMGQLAMRCATDMGCALIIDYGHVQSGFGDTLQAVKDHAYAGVLETPGEADLTAHVDFQALAGTAAAAGANTYGAIGQGDFLNAMGIQERTEVLQANATDQQRHLLLAGRDRLVNQDQMGGLFKVLAITGPQLPVPSGFQSS
ncbi:MAG: SAM-dependent methyltransferase [Rhodospirillales bacterium]|nr:SAM-dependent methyltransferase [Rhodospirillales bacterium]